MATKTVVSADHTTWANPSREFIREKALEAGVSVHHAGASHVFEVTGGHANRLAHLALHSGDLSFARECLRLVEAAADKQTVNAEALWRSAVLHYCKCFGASEGTSKRGQLSPQRIYKAAPNLLPNHELFVTIRNSHLAHDDGTHTLWRVSAGMTLPGAVRKIWSVKATAIDLVTLKRANVRKLKELIDHCTGWVAAECDIVCDLLTSQLEQIPREELLRLDKVALQYGSKGGRRTQEKRPGFPPPGPEG